ncbi:AAA family ATPase [Rhizobium sp. 2YAF20]|uniref:AAA family ATPase n=1 Tax=Rhizobium sp. 2YAF20 TaxID=3233027 RepID=UPI003F9E57D9
MDRLAHFLVRRLRHVAHREVLRQALRNGLVTTKIVHVDGHLVHRYTPAFDLSHLTGDTDRDLHWIRTQFAPFLIEPPKDRAGNIDPLGPAPVLATHLRRNSVETSADRRETDQRLAYTVRLIADAGEAVGIKHIATVLLLAGAIRNAGIELRELVNLLRQPAPIVSIEVAVEGFELALLQLVEKTALVLFGPYVGVSADFMSDEQMWAWKEAEVKRVFLYVLSEDDVRQNRPVMRKRLISALAHGSPVLAVAEAEDGIPDQIDIASDIRLSGARMDRSLLADLLEAVHGEAMTEYEGAIGLIDAAALTLDDLSLAIRPGRSIEASLEALAGLAARNRDDAEGNGSAFTRKIISQSTSQRHEADKDNKSSGDSSSGSGGSSSARWKRKPSGAEVIRPQSLAPEDAKDGKPPLVVEALSGYGAAKDWALGLKADLEDYRTGDLHWSDMSTKLLLSGPPGTGKTIFARALCNSLQVPLVVTSVSTWLQGGYLNDVLHRMANSFAEARDLTPCILFIDEIDGIGGRRPGNHPHSDYWNTCVNKMLELLDGTVKSEGVIVVGATNRPYEIDEAIRRSGRLETHIEIPRPDIPALAGILAHHLGADLDLIAESATQEGAAL